MAESEPLTKAEVFEAIEDHLAAIKALRESVDRVVWAGHDGKSFMGLEAVVVALHGRGEPGDVSVIGALDDIASAIDRHGEGVSKAIGEHTAAVKEHAEEVHGFKKSLCELTENVRDTLGWIADELKKRNGPG